MVHRATLPSVSNAIRSVCIDGERGESNAHRRRVSVSASPACRSLSMRAPPAPCSRRSDSGRNHRRSNRCASRLFFSDAERLGERGQDQRLPLIAGMDFPDAVLLERERVDRFELEVQHAACRISLLERRLAAGTPLRRPRSSTSSMPPFGSAICFAPCRGCPARRPSRRRLPPSTLIRSAARIAAG